MNQQISWNALQNQCVKTAVNLCHSRPVGAGRAGYVYLARHFAAPDGLTKIGFTTDKEARMKELYADLIAAVYCNDASGLENLTHREWAAKRVKGEWFKLDDDDICAIWGMWREHWKGAYQGGALLKKFADKYGVKMIRFNKYSTGDLIPGTYGEIANTYRDDFLCLRLLPASRGRVKDKALNWRKNRALAAGHGTAAGDAAHRRGLLRFQPYERGALQTGD